MNAKSVSRRRFLRQFNCAAVGSAAILNTLLNLKLANNVAADGMAPGTDSKALVCLFMSGGWDSFQMLVPWESSRYASYATTRGAFGSDGGLALNRDALLRLSGTAADYAMHPSMAGMHQMATGTGPFAGKQRLAMIPNIGTLIQPITKSQYGNNVFQVGANTTQFVITPEGSLSFEDWSTAHQLKNTAFRGTLEQHYSNLLSQGFANLTKASDDAQLLFQEQFDSSAADLGAADALFPSNNGLAPTLRAVVRAIKIRSALGLRRQTFFINWGGWDMHGDLLGPQAAMLAGVDAAVSAYQQALEMLGLAADVVTFTASDFGRTLRSNGRGTDHAWGGNAFVFGGPVDGGKMFGTYPDLTLDGPDDVGYGGRLLPGVSADLYFAEMLRWFGVPGHQMAAVLPNIANFWNPLSGTAPLGFIKP